MSPEGGAVAKELAAAPAGGDIVTNLRRLSVQAGIMGGALTAAVGAYRMAVDAAPQSHGAVSGAFTIAIGLVTAASVFFGRLAPQPNLSK